MQKIKERREIGKELISNVYSRLCEFTPKAPAKDEKNWRVEAQPDIDPGNKCKEKILEKKVALHLKENWINQVPVACGRFKEKTFRGCSIDLVHRDQGGRTLEFVELKCDSNTPLYATLEILSYGLMYVLWREREWSTGCVENLLCADRIKLVVLAPRSFYRGHKDGYMKLDWLEREANEGLSKLLAGKQLTGKLSMTFEFQAFGESEYKALEPVLNSARSINGEAGLIMAAIRSRKAAYGRC